MRWIETMRAPFQKKTVIQITLLMALFLTARDVFAQGTRSDYERALNLEKSLAIKFSNKKSFHIGFRITFSFGIATTWPMECESISS